MTGKPRALSEEGLIEAYFAPLAAGYAGAFALKDDCAALSVTEGCDLVVTTDAIAAGVHFFPDDAAFDIGWKALAVNVSDLVAKGARPVAYLMAAAFPAMPESGWLEGFVHGLRAAQDAFGIVLAGGDTDRRPGLLSITITAFGEVPRGGMVRRAGARPGDLLYVSGQLGASALGLRLRADPAFGESLGISNEAHAALVGRYLRPEPPVALAPAVLAHASSAMDISDGLVKDLARLSRAASVLSRVDAARVPLAPGLEALCAMDPGFRLLGLTGGDDYEVLAAVPPGHASAFEAEAAERGVLVTQIGHVAAGAGAEVLDQNGMPMQFMQTGWDHFG